MIGVGIGIRMQMGAVSGLAFSPNQVSSTQAFYDPSDLSSLYQSRTGGDIVSADGQTVGIMLDKSQMGGKTAAAFIASAADIAPTLVPNGTVGYQSESAGKYSLYRDGSGSGSYRITLEAYKWYRIRFYAYPDGPEAGHNIYLNVVSAGVLDYLEITFPEGYRELILYTGSDNRVDFSCTGPGVSWSFSGVTSQELPGHHAIAPSDAARPLYKTAANTGKAGYAAAMAAQPELVTNGTFDTDTDWTKGTGWTISGGVATHDAVASGFLNPITPILEENKTYLISWSVVGTSGLSLRTGTTSTVVVSDMHAVSSAVVTVKGGTALAVYAHAGSMAGPVSIDNVSVKEVPAAYLHRYVDYDGVDDVLNATLPNLGSTASVWYMKQDGTAVYAANQSISGAYALPAVDMRGLIIVDGPISASDQTKLSAYYA